MLRLNICPEAWRDLLPSILLYIKKLVNIYFKKINIFVVLQRENCLKDY